MTEAEDATAGEAYGSNALTLMPKPFARRATVKPTAHKISLNHGDKPAVFHTLPQANNSQGLAFDFHADEFTPLPFPILEARTSRGDLSGHRHHQRDSVLRGCANIAGG